MAPGVQLVDTPQFPAEWKNGALAAREALNLLRQESTLQWTFLSPAILLEPGERTGHYRLGTESPLMNGDQPGKISVADLAVVIVDELFRRSRDFRDAHMERLDAFLRRAIVGRDSGADPAEDIPGLSLIHI